MPRRSDGGREGFNSAAALGSSQSCPSPARLTLKPHRACSPIRTQGTADGVMSAIGLCWSSAATWHCDALVWLPIQDSPGGSQQPAFQSLDQEIDAQFM